MKQYLAEFNEPIEWVSYKDEWDSQNKVWIENGKEVHHFEKTICFYSAIEAKVFIKKHLDKFIKCSIVKVYSNGDWIPCGELNIGGNNSKFIANSERNMKNFNY